MKLFAEEVEPYGKKYLLCDCVQHKCKLHFIITTII